METFKRFKVFMIFFRTAFGKTKLNQEQINPYKIMMNRKNLGMSLVYTIVEQFYGRNDCIHISYISTKNCTFLIQLF